jgi:hypothetical protein
MAPTPVECPAHISRASNTANSAASFSIGARYLTRWAGTRPTSHVRSPDFTKRKLVQSFLRERAARLISAAVLGWDLSVAVSYFLPSTACHLHRVRLAPRQRDPSKRRNDPVLALLKMWPQRLGQVDQRLPLRSRAGSGPSSCGHVSRGQSRHPQPHAQASLHPVVDCLQFRALSLIGFAMHASRFRRRGGRVPVLQSAPSHSSSRSFFRCM